MGAPPDPLGRFEGRCFKGGKGKGRKGRGWGRKGSGSFEAPTTNVFLWQRKVTKNC